MKNEWQRLSVCLIYRMRKAKGAIGGQAISYFASRSALVCVLCIGFKNEYVSKYISINNHRYSKFIDPNSIVKARL